MATCATLLGILAFWSDLVARKMPFDTGGAIFLATSQKSAKHCCCKIASIKAKTLLSLQQIKESISTSMNLCWGLRSAQFSWLEYLIQAIISGMGQMWDEKEPWHQDWYAVPVCAHAFDNLFLITFHPRGQDFSYIALALPWQPVQTKDGVLLKRFILRWKDM